jgi:hypothetical protein
MTLLQKQFKFASLVAQLIQKAEDFGFTVTLGDAFRLDKKCHGMRLAIDLNLFRDGKYLSDTASHRLLGEWWEQQAPECRWGGRFSDGNHYSFTHRGIA